MGYGTNMEESDRPRSRHSPGGWGALDAAAPPKSRIVYRIEPNTWFSELDLVGSVCFELLWLNLSVTPLREAGQGHRTTTVCFDPWLLIRNFDGSKR